MMDNDIGTNEDERILGELNEVIHKTAFLVAFSKIDGEPIAIIPGKDCKVLETGCLPVPSKLITDIAETSEKEFMETRSYTFSHLFGSPGCYIPTARGGWKCICCG